jgi:flavin-dependent dehydrogenase
MSSWDVAVIGGGVAGSTAAMWLARGGLRVVLVDKGAFPRHKVCGEFLSPEGAQLLQRLGVWPRVMSHRPPRLHTVTLSSRAHEVHCPLSAPGWGVRRWTLDRLLWEQAGSAGVTTWSQSAVRRVSGDSRGGFTLTVQRPRQPLCHLHAQAVICAAGRHWRSSMAETAALHPWRRQCLGLKVHVQGVPLAGRVELHTLRQGYCGLAEVDGGMTTVCCWVGTEAFRQAGGTPERFLARAVQENPYLQRRLRPARRLDMPWTTVAYTPRRAAIPIEDGIWRVGDSAAMIAPLTGDGMGLGMQAAARAATLMLAAFRHELTWAEASAAYERSWRQGFSARLRWGRRLELILRHPWGASLACMALGTMPSLIEAMYRRTRDLALAATREATGRGRPHPSPAGSCDSATDTEQRRSLTP